MDKLFEMWEVAERRGVLQQGVESAITPNETKEEKREKMRVRLAYATWQALKGSDRGPIRPLWPPKYHRDVKALERSLPQVDYDLVIGILQSLLDELKRPLEGEDPANTEEVVVKMKHVNTTRKIFKTDGAELGLGTESIENGDEVWLLVGADVPFTLRKIGEGEYRIVGEAYVHGVMHGEAVDRSPAALNPVSIFLV